MASGNGHKPGSLEEDNNSGGDALAGRGNRATMKELLFVTAIGGVDIQFAHVRSKDEDAFDLVLPSMPGYGFSGRRAVFRSVCWRGDIS